MQMKRRSALNGKVAIITGASSGIGEATAREFARAGAITVLAARRKERLERLQAEIETMGGRALAVPTDVTQPDQIKHLVQTTVSNFGRIDILANIAGWALYQWLEKMSHEDLQRAFNVNVIGMAEMMRQVIPVMQRQHSGMIINMSSYASRISTPPLTVYASTKYAVEGLTDGMRRELLPWGITVMRVHPSSVSGTEFNDRVVREGGIRYRSLPIGQISRERLARRLVELIEQPHRALFISRLYDPLVFLNRYVPALVDRFTAGWVRNKRKTEIPPSTSVASVRYKHSYTLLPILGAFMAFALVAKARRKKA